MIYPTRAAWQAAPHKRIALFGMSGLGKTHLSTLLRDSGGWFHYSVDFRIGTRYMGEHIVDNFKREAMKVPFLRELLMSDSIYIGSNLTFHNLAPLSTYLGKPGDPARGGIPFDEYVERQRQHALAEQAATQDAAVFAHKGQDIYGYPHFVADTSGSLCEVVDPEDKDDPVLRALARDVLPVWIRGDAAHVDLLAARFDKAPKPMFYQEPFLMRIWGEYLAEKGVAEARVDPDDFIRWGFRRLMDHRLPRYAAMAQRWGVTVTADEVAAVASAHDLVALVGEAIARREHPA
ncbi:MAG: ATPase [Pseudomonadota bacterium]